MGFLRILLPTLVLVGVCLGSQSSFQWTPDLENALRKMYHHAKLSGDSPERRIKDEWDHVFPMYSYLDIHYLWQHAQASSGMSGMDNEKRERRQNFRWKPEFRSELVEIYHETDPSTKNHSRRVHNEWVKRHEKLSYMEPQYLLEKARTFIDESKSRKIKIKSGFFRWAPKHRFELIEIYKDTDSGASNHSGRIYDEWIKRHGELSYMNPRYLLDTARTFIDKSKMRKTKKPRKAYEWTEDLNDELMKAVGENAEVSEEVYQEWIAKHPEFRNISLGQLKKREYYLRRRRRNPNEWLESKKPGEKSDWTKKHDDNLVKIYFKNDGQSQKVYEGWVKMYPDFKKVTPELLLQRALHLTRQENVTTANRLSKADIVNNENNDDSKRPRAIHEWTREHDQNLLNIYLKNNRQSQKIQEEWVKMYPDFKNVTPGLLMQRAWRLSKHKNMTDASKVRKYFKWTEDLKADFSHIYRRTDTGEKNHLDRVWDCWKKMHPELIDIGRNNLRTLKSNLLRAGYMPSAKDEEKAQERFDRLSMTHLYRSNYTEASPKRMEMLGGSVSSPARDLPSTSQQHHDDYDIYRDMPMFSPLPQEHFYDDPYQYMDPSLLDYTRHEDPYFHN